MTEEILKIVHGECSAKAKQSALLRAKNDADFAQNLKQTADFDALLKERFAQAALSAEKRMNFKPKKRASRNLFIFRFLKAAAIPVAAVGVFGFAAYSLFLESKNAVGYNGNDANVQYLYIDISKLAANSGAETSQIAAHKSGIDTFNFKFDKKADFVPLVQDSTSPADLAFANVAFPSFEKRGLPPVNSAQKAVKNSRTFEGAVAEFAAKRTQKSGVKFGAKPEVILVSSSKTSASANIENLGFDVAGSVQKILSKSPKAANFKRAENFLKDSFTANPDAETLALLAKLYADKRNPNMNLELAKKYETLAQIKK